MALSAFASVEETKLGELRRRCWRICLFCLSYASPYSFPANPQDRMSNDSNNNNDGDNDNDDTPSKLRRSLPSSVNQRSRYEIDHGIHHPISTNLGTSNNNDNNVSNHGGSNSVGNYGIDIPLACGSPQQSPTTEGLHHRTRTKPVPTHQLSSSQASSSSRDHRQPYPHRTQRRSYYHDHTNRGGELALWNEPCNYSSRQFCLGIVSFCTWRRIRIGARRSSSSSLGIDRRAICDWRC